MCMAYLHMKVWDFWEHTPIEIDYALKSYYEQRFEDIKTDWERTRTDIYYQYLFTPTKKRKVTYSEFKKEYLRFGFDEEKQIDVMNDETFEAIDKIFIERLNNGGS
jgi:hypothetical protein